MADVDAAALRGELEQALDNASVPVQGSGGGSPVRLSGEVQRAAMRAIWPLVASRLAAKDDLIRFQEARLAEVTQQRDEAQKTADIRQRMIDIPTAWELTRATPSEQHHEKCSYRVAAMLCDCAAFRVMEHVGGLLRGISKREAQLAIQSQEVARLREALEELRINANRPCDRMLGRTYEADCRRSIAKADTALSRPLAEATQTPPHSGVSAGTPPRPDAFAPARQSGGDSGFIYNRACLCGGCRVGGSGAHVPPAQTPPTEARPK